MDNRCACGGCGIGRGYFPQDVTGHERVSDSIDDVYNTRCNMRPPPDIMMRKGYLYSFYNVCFSVPRPRTTRANKDLWIELSLKALEYLEDTLTPNSRMRRQGAWKRFTITCNMHVKPYRVTGSAQ